MRPTLSRLESGAFSRSNQRSHTPPSAESLRIRIPFTQVPTPVLETFDQFTFPSSVSYCLDVVDTAQQNEYLRPLLNRTIETFETLLSQVATAPTP